MDTRLARLLEFDTYAALETAPRCMTTGGFYQYRCGTECRYVKPPCSFLTFCDRLDAVAKIAREFSGNYGTWGPKLAEQESGIFAKIAAQGLSRMTTNSRQFQTFGTFYKI